MEILLLEDKRNSNQATRLLISLYDGPEQITKFKNLISKLKIPEDFVILRDRWYSDKIDYDKINNRVEPYLLEINQKQNYLKTNVIIQLIKC